MPIFIVWRILKKLHKACGLLLVDNSKVSMRKEGVFELQSWKFKRVKSFRYWNANVRLRTTKQSNQCCRCGARHCIPLPCKGNVRKEAGLMSPVGFKNKIKAPGEESRLLIRSTSDRTVRSEKGFEGRKLSMQ